MKIVQNINIVNIFDMEEGQTGIIHKWHKYKNYDGMHVKRVGIDLVNINDSYCTWSNIFSDYIMEKTKEPWISCLIKLD